MSSSTQMLKGILEGCLLSLIARGETYGYEMIEKLEQFGFDMVSEGSIYPVLMRLQKEGFVSTELKASPHGPKRKYYRITPSGLNDLTDFQTKWKELAKAVDTLIHFD